MLAACVDAPDVGALGRGFSSLVVPLPSNPSSQQVLQGTGRPSVTIKGVGP